MKKIVLLLTLLVTYVSFSFASEFQYDPAWEKYITSQKKLQVAMHHLLRRHHHDLKSVIEQSQGLQLMRADIRTFRFNHLQSLTPSRIVRNQGFEAFVHFSWSQDNQSKLEALNPDYHKLVKKASKLREELESDPRYEQIQEQMETLKKEREYREILARFRFVKRDVEEMLSAGGSGNLAEDWTRTL